jgi:hypothetical protein
VWLDSYLKTTISTDMKRTAKQNIPSTSLFV